MQWTGFRAVMISIGLAIATAGVIYRQRQANTTSIRDQAPLLPELPQEDTIPNSYVVNFNPPGRNIERHFQDVARIWNDSVEINLVNAPNLDGRVRLGDDILDLPVIFDGYEGLPDGYVLLCEDRALQKIRSDSMVSTVHRQEEGHGFV